MGCSPERSVTIYQTTLRHIKEYSNLQTQCSLQHAAVWSRLQCNQRPIFVMLHEQVSVSPPRYLGPHLRHPGSVAARLPSVPFKEIRNGRQAGSGYTRHVIIIIINIISSSSCLSSSSVQGLGSRVYPFRPHLSRCLFKFLPRFPGPCYL
jgi:hypothetical protein